MQELLPGVQTLGLYEASLLALLLVQRRYRTWKPGWLRPHDAPDRALRGLAVHLVAALQLAQRARSEAGESEGAEDSRSPVLVEADELSRQIEAAIITAWLQLSRNSQDRLQHLDEFGKLGDAVVFRYCEALLQRSLFDAALFYRIGTVFEERGHVVRALDTYRRVVALDPTFQDAQARIAALKGLTSGVELITPAPTATITPAPAPVRSTGSVSVARSVLTPAPVAPVVVEAGAISQSRQSLARIELATVSAKARPSVATREAAPVHVDVKRRAESLAAQTSAHEPSPRDLMDAELSFKKAVAALNSGNHAQAIEALRKAIEKKPADPDYAVYLTWATFDDPRATKSALAQESMARIQTFLTDHPQFGRGHYWIGMIWKFLDDEKKAEASFKAAIGHDKTLMEAERELRLLRMRRERR
jgi:tetratricopeptide (TPR) repeat protein